MAWVRLGRLPLRLATRCTGNAAHAAAAIYDHALAVGFSRGFEVSAAIMLLALIVTVAMIRVRRQDLAGVQPVPTVRPEDPAAARAGG